MSRLGILVLVCMGISVPDGVYAAVVRAQVVDSVDGTSLIPMISPAGFTGAQFIGTGVQDTFLASSLGAAGSDTDIAADYIEPDATDITTYIVQPGDTVASIAKVFGVSTNTIYYQNDLKKGATIKPGDELIILPVDGVKYTVKRGDTLSRIATTYRGDIESIKQFNDIDSNADLVLGKSIIIPGGELPVSVVKKAPAKTPTKSGAGRILAGPNGAIAGYIDPLMGRGILTQGAHTRYRAIDVGVAVGNPLVASMDGTVAIANKSGWGGGYGKYVLLKHVNGSMTMYAHMSTVSVSAGQSVRQGEQIGLSGNSGRSTGPHLHFEIRNGPITAPVLR